MSRTIKGAKGCGYEYWGKRPFSFSSPQSRPHTGLSTKQLTHKIERGMQKRELRKELP